MKNLFVYLFNSGRLYGIIGFFGWIFSVIGVGSGLFGLVGFTVVTLISSILMFISFTVDVSGPDVDMDL